MSYGYDERDTTRTDHIHYNYTASAYAYKTLNISFSFFLQKWATVSARCARSMAAKLKAVKMLNYHVFRNPL